MVIPERHEQGIVLMVTLMVVVVLTSLTGALIPQTSTATRVAANHRLALQAHYAADAALAWAVEELRRVPSWTAVRAGTRRSSFRAGSRQRQLADGAIWDLEATTHELRNAGAGASGVARGLTWRLYAYGPFDLLVPRDPTGGVLTVAVWVADAGTLLEDALVLHAVAAGPASARRAVQATLQRLRPDRPPAVVSWALVQ